MSAILLSADEDPENWIKLTRAILEEVYGKELAYLSAKGTRRSQGIYVPLYHAIYGKPYKMYSLSYRNPNLTENRLNHAHRPSCEKKKIACLSSRLKKFRFFRKLVC